jgi:hypothetical protein
MAKTLLGTHVMCIYVSLLSCHPLRLQVGQNHFIRPCVLRYEYDLGASHGGSMHLVCLALGSSILMVPS